MSDVVDRLLEYAVSGKMLDDESYDVLGEDLQVGLAGAGSGELALRSALASRLSSERRWSRYTNRDGLVRSLTNVASSMREWYDAVDSLREADGGTDNAVARLKGVVEEVVDSWLRKSSGRIGVHKPRLGEDFSIQSRMRKWTDIVQHLAAVDCDTDLEDGVPSPDGREALARLNAAASDDGDVANAMGQLGDFEAVKLYLAAYKDLCGEHSRAAKVRECVRRELVRIVEHDMSLDTIVKPKVVGDDACPDCRGTGVYLPAFGTAEECRTCNGTGSRTGVAASPMIHVKNPIEIIIDEDEGGDIAAFAVEWEGDVSASTPFDDLLDALESDLGDVYLDNAERVVLGASKHSRSPRAKRIDLAPLRDLAARYGSTHAIDMTGNKVFSKGLVKL